MKIFIVEDEPIEALDLKHILGRLGYSVTGAAMSGEECIRQIPSDPPDLIIMDIRLRGDMDGIDAAAELRKKYDIPIIFATAFSDKTSLTRAKLTEPYGYIIKPYDERNLYTTIEMSLDKYRIDRRLKESEIKYRNLSSHLQSLREAERTQIAREIHDELGQSLTALKMDISWIKNRLPSGQNDLFEKMGAMSSLVDTIIDTVRRISSELRPGILDDLGLHAAIEWCADEFQKRNRIPCRVSCNTDDLDIDEMKSITIYRIFQESLTNIIRHAHATEVAVSLVREGDALILTVQDNGRGISEEEINDPSSLGIIGIRERALSCGGTAFISGVTGRGTTVKTVIPLEGSEQ
ncbi:MAG: hypothetical protein A2W19_08250 [Spirochaetes bacterium RBG_16_49_21]|nr:MAG: hypothetical protein A2W19_08250 [Spirochaetes bacterium RBG_16_49_21]